MDELNAHIGELITYLEGEEDRKFLTGIQCDLFTIGAYLATEPSRAEKFGREVVTGEDVARLEQAIDEAEDGLPGWRGFVLPGGSRGDGRMPCLPHRVPQGGTAYFGTVRKCAVMPEVCAYVNRLSDYLFVLSRKNAIYRGER